MTEYLFAELYEGEAYLAGCRDVDLEAGTMRLLNIDMRLEARLYYGPVDLRLRVEDDGEATFHAITLTRPDISPFDDDRDYDWTFERKLTGDRTRKGFPRRTSNAVPSPAFGLPFRTGPPRVELGTLG